MDTRYQFIPAWQIREGVGESIEDPVTRESPLTIILNDRELITLLCTWEHVDELAVGFLQSEGFIKAGDDIPDVRIDEEQGSAIVKTARQAAVAEQTFLKRYITTGCGKGTSFYNLSDAVCRPVETGFTVTSAQIFKLMTEAQRMSEMFKITGGVHSSAICTRDNILFFREDIGRHNSVDKLTGRCFYDKIDPSDKLLLTTGRISSEILIKAAKMGVPVIASRSAPTDLAVKYAADLGVTVIAFVRSRRMNIYTHPERVVPQEEQR